MDDLEGMDDLERRDDLERSGQYYLYTSHITHVTPISCIDTRHFQFFSCY
ncbi:hypothetical protein Lalb_Chr19g0138561 [Lupinus albus]|uniref:Uncharacterized protein n=1 Tax=Lupinus albus TaxID=3870 RepID=A0A6A4NZJ7_LUPAL|nr:hypothetical protein Lalb_Chr19g0138561 [Lupinus albus]